MLHPAAAAFIALVLGEDGPLFPYHAIIGLVIALMVVLRIAWGLAGTRYARFRSFLFSPRAVLAYSVGIITGRGERHVGHNPGSAYAILAMLALSLGLAVTGVMMGRGDESVKEIHELLAYGMLALVAAHVLGVILHTVRHRENITASMVHGYKSAEPAAAIQSMRPLVAIGFLMASGAWAAGLLGGYDAATQTTTVPLVGTVLQLGGAEGNDDGSRSGHGGSEPHDEREDD